MMPRSTQPSLVNGRRQRHYNRHPFCCTVGVLHE
jgi:hypothetical protein